MGQLTRSKPQILVVGAGAVGQAYGYHLSRGGADVTYLVKEKHLDETRGGFLLYRHRLFQKPEPFHFGDFEVMSLGELDAVGRRAWDQVWLCISSTALKGEWLADLCGRIGEATLVSLQPGLEDSARVCEVYDPKKIVLGLITLIAYQTPLPGEHLRPGVAYLLPPMAPIPFCELNSASHPVLQRRATRVAEALEKGDCPARVDPKTPQLAAFGAAAMVPMVAGLEIAGWSLGRFRKSAAIAFAGAAAKEAQQIVGDYFGIKPPRMMGFLRRPELLAVGLRLAPRMLPFDLETYLKYHFTKVGAQTRQIIDGYIELGETHERTTRGLRVLRRLLSEQ